MKSNQILKLLAGLGLAFALPWLCLVIVPFQQQSNAAPVPYAEEDGMEGGPAAYPDSVLQRYGASDYGRKIYAAEGCAYCHTQVIRPTYAGPDRWRDGWGGREDGGGKFVRETVAGDYATERYAPLGYQRIGQDLSNVAYRIKTKEEMHRHLYDPKSFDRDSGMPAYRHLYKQSPYGDGLVPTPKAEALVDYLMSLKKDQPLPASLARKK